MRYVYVTFILLCVFVGIPLMFLAFYEEAKKERAQISSAFKQACESVGGKAVFNRKYWECLK